MNHFFAFISRMRNIKRWSLMRNSYEENDMEHAAQTAILAHALAVIRNAKFGGDVDADRVSTLALYHDSSEVITGDMATPIKYYNPEIERAFKSIELVASRKLLSMLPESLQDTYAEYLSPDTQSEEWRIVKAADTLAAYLKCVEELKAGNGEFRSAAVATLDKLHSMKRPEVLFFLNEFASSFAMTLDELG
ncbi:MAG: 5'-deoxynucleotidase [Oscillospiraceae bacterium]|jgi:5'-deoxynucleotidase|nr:5'-deoxynucleotidase [Oscillospiraceae bacterium]